MIMHGEADIMCDRLTTLLWGQWHSFRWFVACSEDGQNNFDYSDSDLFFRSTEIEQHILKWKGLQKVHKL